MLFQSAAANDLPKFEATLARAKTVVETLPLGNIRNRLRQSILIAGDLERVWRYSAEDPHGIYFDEQGLPDYYDRLAKEYPEFEAYISAYRVIDKTGRVLYPTRETRDFLMRRLNPHVPSA